MDLTQEVNNGVLALSAGLLRITERNKLLMTFDLRYVLLLDYNIEREELKIV